MQNGLKDSWCDCNSPEFFGNCSRRLGSFAEDGLGGIVEYIYILYSVYIYIYIYDYVYICIYIFMYVDRYIW